MFTELQLLRSIPPVIKRLDADLPVEELKTMPQQVRENVFLDRMISILSTAFALIATMLAAVGLYGVLAYSVAQRTREIGIRMALGANASTVRRLIVRQGMSPAVIGLGVGLMAAFWLTGLMDKLLYGVAPRDPVTFASVLSMVPWRIGAIALRMRGMTTSRLCMPA